MIKKQVPVAENKVLKLKTRKPATQALHNKRYSQPFKSVTHGTKKTPMSGPRRRPLRSDIDRPLSKLNDPNAVNILPKPKRSKPVKENDMQAGGLVRHDDVETQMRLYEESLKEKQVCVKIPSANVDERLTMSPNSLCENMNLPEVSTPFNKRLVSSTPDPDKLLERDEESIVYQPPDCLFRGCSSPHMVSERDSGVDDKEERPKLTLSGVDKLVRQQQQNQLAWHQHLVQHQNVVNPSTQPPEGQHFPAVHDLLRVQRSTMKSFSNPYSTSERNVKEVFFSHPYPKAEWIQESAATVIRSSAVCQSQSCCDDTKSDSYADIPQTNRDSCVPYTTFGASSSKQDKDKIVQNSSAVKQSLDSVGAHGSKHENYSQVVGTKTGENQVNVLPSKSTLAGDSNLYDRFACSRLPSSVKQKPNFNLLPPSANDRLRSQNFFKTEATAQTHTQLKKERVKEASADERRIDIPPSETVTADFDTPLSDDKKMSDDVNLSLSTCSEEVNTLLSSESIDRKVALYSGPVVESCSKEVQVPRVYDKRYDEPVFESCPEEAPVPRVHKQHLASSASDTSDGLANLNELGSCDKLAILDVLSDGEDISCTRNIASLFEADCRVLKDVRKSSEAKDDIGVELDQTLCNKEEDRSTRIKAAPKPGNMSASPIPKTNKSGELGGSDNKGVQPELDIGEDEKDKEKNVNQNYHDSLDRRHYGRRPLDLHYLDTMADSTLYNIACQMALKGSTIRDARLQHLINSMIFHTDSVLAHQDEKFQSSQMLFADENNKLKKRIHTINKQLEVKERLERQADIGVSNTDVMHLERKNLYLRQEKDRLDQQVTNLLEEKAKWLITQQDLVKTVSLKDREILKLESRHQDEKKSLHQTLDQATKNSQGVHYKLSVADREISNLEQRMKSKEREFCELKDTLRDLERDLNDNVDLSTKKDVEISRLQDLVDTLKAGVDEVLKAYEAGSHGREESEDRRRGIHFLQQMIAKPEPARHSSARKQPTTESFHRSTQDERGSRSGQKHPSSHQYLHSIPGMDRGLPPLFASESLDSSLPATGERDVEPSGLLTTASDGSSLTRQAIDEHNQRFSPIDRKLWHSLDSHWAVPVISGVEEPYYSDSEIHAIHPRGRRRHHDKARQYGDSDFIHIQRKRCSSLSPKRHKDRGSRHNDLLNTNEKFTRRLKEIEEKKRSKVRDQNRFSVTEEMSGMEGEEIFTSTKRGQGHVSHEADDLDTLPLQGQSFAKAPKKFQYKETNRIQHSDRIHSMTPLEYPMNSRGHWRDVEDEEEKARQYKSLLSSKSDLLRQSKDRERRLSHADETSTSSSSLKSTCIPDLLPLNYESYLDPTISTVDERDASTRMFTLSSNGKHFRSLEHESQQGPSTTSNPLSSSYPSYSHSRHGKSTTLSGDQLSTLKSTSLPLSSDHDKEEEEIQYQRHQHFRRPSQQDTNGYHQCSTHQRDNSTDFKDFQMEPARRGTQRVLYTGQNPSQHSKFASEKRTVTFHEQSDDSLRTPLHSFHSDRSNYRTSFPPQSSPVHTSDISISRRATRDTNSFQRDFFQGTELSASFSSISEQDIPRDAFDNSNNNVALDEASFATGIASLDSKIARLQEKINRTKAVFS